MLSVVILLLQFCGCLNVRGGKGREGGVTCSKTTQCGVSGQSLRDQLNRYVCTPIFYGIISIWHSIATYKERAKNMREMDTILQMRDSLLLTAAEGAGAGAGVHTSTVRYYCASLPVMTARVPRC